MRNVLLRLSGSLVAVVGLWMLVWLPLVLTESSAAEPQEQTLGDPQAPVTIIEYASLTCPHCAQFHTEVLPELKERYIAPGQGAHDLPGLPARSEGADGGRARPLRRPGPLLQLPRRAVSDPGQLGAGRAITSRR